MAPDGQAVEGTERQRFPERIEVDALFLANGVEVRDGLLYVLGGGWMRCWPRNGQLPFDKLLPIAMLFRVPYGDTNVEHKFSVSVRDSDEKELIKPGEGAFKVGRPADLTGGMSQIVPMALQPTVKIERTGIYHVVVEIGGEERRRIAFEALPRAPQTR